MNRKRSSRDFGDQDDEAEARVAQRAGEETPDRGLLHLVDQLLALAPDRDPSRRLLYQLRRQVMEREITLQEARRTLIELEAALEKLTAPANRIGIFLGSPREGIALVVVGGAEYYANIDPRVEVSRLRVGCRVLINEAYAVIGDLGYHPSGPVVKIGDLLDAGRLRVFQPPGGQEAILERSAELQGVDLKVGDEVRVDPSFRVALEVLKRRENREYFLEVIPEMPWSCIGGQEEAIRAIRDAIEMPARYPDLFARFQYAAPKGFLLYGPPGCGKTMIGKATAYNLVQHLRTREGLDLREYFMHVKGPEILNMWLGETERLVREIFAQARQKRREGYLPFVFIDEAESILGTRRSMRTHYIANTVVPMFCAEMDGIESLHDVVVILASNRHDLIDPAILRPGRIDRKIKVKRPDREAAREIFGIYLTPELPLDRQEVARCGNAETARRALIEVGVEALFDRSDEARFLEVWLRNGRREVLFWGDLASGAIIASVVQRAKEMAIKRAIAGQDPEAGLSSEDLCQAVRAEFKENEVFPTTDSLEDWLKLLDCEPENVVRVSPFQAWKQSAESPSGKVV